jgi:hypothetical protein
MKVNGNTIAIELLRKRQQEIREEAAAIELSIQYLETHREKREVPAQSTEKVPRVRPGEYIGMGKYHALVHYLKDRPGPVKLSVIRKALQTGGLKLSEKTRKGMTKAKSQGVNLINRVTNHSQVLGWDDKTRTVWLKSLAAYVPLNRPNPLKSDKS